MDDLIHAGRSTLDQKKRVEIYAKAQRLIFDDAAYLYKWGLRGVWVETSIRTSRSAWIFLSPRPSFRGGRLPTPSPRVPFV